MRVTIGILFVGFAWLSAADSPPLRLGSPAPDWAVESAAGGQASLARHLRDHKKDAALLVPRQGQSIPRPDLEAAARRLGERGVDLLVVPPQPGPGRPGLEPIAPATVLVDSAGVVRRIEPGRLLAVKELEEFVEQWRLGREVFLTACARCHGDDGSLEVCGDVKPLTGIGNRLTPAQVYERLRVGELGKEDVLVRGRFHKRKEVEAVVVFVRGL